MATPVQARPGRRFGRTLLRLALAALMLYAGLTAGLYWAMRQPPDLFGRIMARTPMPLMMVLPFETLWKHARRGRLGPGDAAPDFNLPSVDHGSGVRLSAFRGSLPVVLVFGSYT